MQLATTTCSYSNPVDFSGAAASSGQPFAFASSTCMIESDVSSSSPILSVFTGGEIVMTVFAFLTMIVCLFWGFHFWLKGIKIRQ